MAEIIKSVDSNISVAHGLKKALSNFCIVLKTFTYLNKKNPKHARNYSWKLTHYILKSLELLIAFDIWSSAAYCSDAKELLENLANGQ